MGKLKKIWFRKHKKESGFCYDTKWMWRCCLFFGIMPLTRTSSGMVQFKFYSWAMLYSIVIYLFFIFLGIKYIVIKRLNILLTLTDDYDGYIYNLMFLFFMKSQFFCSIIGWYSAKRIAHVHNMWMEFEAKFEKTLKNKLILKSLNKLTNRTIFLHVSIILSLLCGQRLTLPTYTLYEGIGFIAPLSGYALINSMVYVNYTAIEMASDRLLKNLKVALRVPVTQDIIISYKRLWIDLSNLTQLLGVALSSFCTMWVLAVLIDMVTSGYGYIIHFISRMKLNNDNSIITMVELGLLVAFAISVYLIVVCGNCTYHAKKKVEESFVDVLCLAATKPYHPKVVQEIDLFLLAIKTNPPLVTLSGYISLDREFITKVISTIMTYLVVLMQFRVGLDKTG